MVSASSSYGLSSLPLEASASTLAFSVSHGVQAKARPRNEQRSAVRSPWGARTDGAVRVARREGTQVFMKGVEISNEEATETTAVTTVSDVEVDSADEGSGAATGRLALRGPVMDLLTPFTSEGDIDFAAYGTYLQFLSRAGVHTVLCNGQTGEFASLTIGERRSLVEFTRETFSGTVLNHVSASALPDVTRLIAHSSAQGSVAHKQATELRRLPAAPLHPSRGGCRSVADAVLVMPPYSSFGGGLVDEGGTEAFLRRALQGCELPVFLYSMPGVPISLPLYARLCADYPTVSGILDGGGDMASALALKSVLPARQLLVAGDSVKGSGQTGNGMDSIKDGVIALKAGADACVVGACNPLPELAVRLQACFDRGDVHGVALAQRRLGILAKKLEMMPGPLVPIVKAAVAARVPGFNVHTRPPYKDLEHEAAAGLKRWVVNNDDVVREKQNAHIKKISAQLSEVYQRVCNTVEVAALEMLFKQLTDAEDRLFSYLEQAKRKRAELNGRSLMNAGAGEAEAAKLLSNVMEARRQLEEDADADFKQRRGYGGDSRLSVPTPSASSIQARLREAEALAQRSAEHLNNLNGLSPVSSADDSLDSDQHNTQETAADFAEIMELNALLPEPSRNNDEKFPAGVPRSEASVRGDAFDSSPVIDSAASGMKRPSSATHATSAVSDAASFIDVDPGWQQPHSAAIEESIRNPARHGDVDGGTKFKDHDGNSCDSAVIPIKPADVTTSESPTAQLESIAGGPSLDWKTGVGGVNLPGNDDHCLDNDPVTNKGTEASAAGEGRKVTRERDAEDAEKMSFSTATGDGVTDSSDTARDSTVSVGPAGEGRVADDNFDTAFGSGLLDHSNDVNALGKQRSTSTSISSSGEGHHANVSNPAGGSGADLSRGNGSILDQGLTVASAADRLSRGNNVNAAASNLGGSTSIDHGSATHTVPSAAAVAATQIPLKEASRKAVIPDEAGEESAARGAGGIGMSTASSSAWATLTPAHDDYGREIKRKTATTPTLEKSVSDGYVGEKKQRTAGKTEGENYASGIRGNDTSVADFRLGPTYEGRRYTPDVRRSSAGGTTTGATTTGNGNPARQPLHYSSGRRGAVAANSDGTESASSRPRGPILGKNNNPLPMPRYGRYIPEGSPPSTPQPLSPEFPFESKTPVASTNLGTPRRYPPPERQSTRRSDRVDSGAGRSNAVRGQDAPKPQSKSGKNTGASVWGAGGGLHVPPEGPRGGVIRDLYRKNGGVSSSGSSTSAAAAAAAASPSTAGGGFTRDSEAYGGKGRAGGGHGTERGTAPLEKRFSGMVDDFREKEKDTFFKSKGIEADVDSFNWDELRRNTNEIENLQRQAVERHRALREHQEEESYRYYPSKPTQRDPSSNYVKGRQPYRRP